MHAKVIVAAVAGSVTVTIGGAMLVVGLLPFVFEGVPGWGKLVLTVTGSLVALLGPAFAGLLVTWQDDHAPLTDTAVAGALSSLLPGVALVQLVAATVAGASAMEVAAQGMMPMEQRAAFTTDLMVGQFLAVWIAPVVLVLAAGLLGLAGGAVGGARRFGFPSAPRITWLPIPLTALAAYTVFAMVRPLQELAQNMVGTQPTPFVSAVTLVPVIVPVLLVAVTATLAARNIVVGHRSGTPTEPWLIAAGMVLAAVAGYAILLLANTGPSLIANTAVLAIAAAVLGAGLGLVWGLAMPGPLAYDDRPRRYRDVTARALGMSLVLTAVTLILGAGFLPMAYAAVLPAVNAISAGAPFDSAAAVFSELRYFAIMTIVIYGVWVVVAFVVSFVRAGVRRIRATRHVPVHAAPGPADPLAAHGS